MTYTAFTVNGVYLGLILADALAALSSLPSNTFNVVVTSPPYYWARDYGYEGQIGHEESVHAFVSSLATVFSEVKRVLHPEGVFYLNIADTYYSGNGQPHGADPRSPSRNFMRKKYRAVDQPGWGIPKKSMLGIPWKVAFELQNRGWTLRSDIIWNRTNAFVEPTARDRPYRQYEHLFLFSKSRFYSYDRSSLCGEEDVWNIAIGRNGDSSHNARFPDELAKRCILTGSPIGGFVLDPFVGSGTTLRAAARLGRNAIGVDLGHKILRDAEKSLKSDFDLRSIEWQDLVSSLSNEPTGWKTWAGNRANFRKPGRGKSADSNQTNT